MNFSHSHRLLISWLLKSALLLAQIQANAVVAFNVEALKTLTINTADQPNPTLQVDFIQPTEAIMAKDIKSNLTAITWAHAVNSQQELKEALENDIDMIEADIVLGKLNSTGPDLPVMAHPPANSSDITLEAFLRQIMNYNDEHAEQTKGVKLDFKSIEVFEGSLGILGELVPTMTYPVWLNADIIRGPVGENKTIPVDPARFLAGCAPFKKAVLSIGWTTNWGANFSEGAYTAHEIDDMVNAIKFNNLTVTKQPITFPVRAGIAANSREQLHKLVSAVNDTNQCSLTIWSSQNDHVNIAKLRELIFSMGLDRVYLDVPAEVANELDLGRDEGNSAQFSSLVNFSMITICVFAASLLIQRMHL